MRDRALAAVAAAAITVVVWWLLTGALWPALPVALALAVTAGLVGTGKGRK